MLSACDKVYINGDLDGMWQLQKVENSEDNTAEYKQNIYYSFQRNLTFISKQNETDVPLRYLGNLYYSEQDKSVTINGLRNFPNEKYIATLDDLKQFMIFDINTTFKILELDNEQLIMEHKNYRYYLKRW
jgi:hypothetical protein